MPTAKSQTERAAHSAYAALSLSKQRADLLRARLMAQLDLNTGWPPTDVMRHAELDVLVKEARYLVKRAMRKAGRTQQIHNEIADACDIAINEISAELQRRDIMPDYRAALIKLHSAASDAHMEWLRYVNPPADEMGG